MLPPPSQPLLCDQWETRILPGGFLALTFIMKFHSPPPSFQKIFDGSGHGLFCLEPLELSSRFSPELPLATFVFCVFFYKRSTRSLNSGSCSTAKKNYSSSLIGCGQMMCALSMCKYMDYIHRRDAERKETVKDLWIGPYSSEKMERKEGGPRNTTGRNQNCKPC